MEKTNKEFGFVLPIFKLIITTTSKWTSICLGFRKLKDFESAYIKGEQSRTNNKSDRFNLIWFSLSIVIYFSIQLFLKDNLFKYCLLFIIVMRQINLITSILRPIFIEPQNTRKTDLINITSFQRNLLYAFLHYIEMIFLFASIYSIFHSSISYGAAQNDDFANLYFSGVSQMTIGYGEITPKNGIRFIVLIQALFGLLIFALTIGTLIGKVKLEDEPIK